MLALQFGNLSNYPVAIALAKENSNLSVLAADKAIIRRREGKWMANPTIDIATLKGAFGASEETSSGATVTAEAPRPCKMALGDFKRLGDFLNEFSSYGLFGNNGTTL